MESNAGEAEALSLNEREVIKRLIAHSDLDTRSPLNSEAARYLIRALAPVVLKIVREQIAEERRRLAGSEKQA